jgi:hypothetical protein
MNVLKLNKIESKLVSDAWAQLFKCMHIAGRSKRN